MTRGKSGRVAALEAKRRAFDAAHIPFSEVSGFLLAVLEVVQEEAGQAAFQDVAGRIVGEKTRRVAALTGGT
ncbi:hypothetical protein [uncultured Deinococcus sp.]|uniref:hypothetical protein n=1 Tax=uncultured Deinococcus sp. TaxID=158789 RepID=UPI0025DF0047|nr:hypothetical protein [uncultured Deinococcus sp.]